MKFTLNKITYIVHFHYITPLGRDEYDVAYHTMMLDRANSRLNHTKPEYDDDETITFGGNILKYGQGVTTCHIKAFTNMDVKDESYISVRSCSINHPNESYSRQEGRRIAFERAITTFIQENKLNLTPTDKKAVRAKLISEYNMQYKK